MINHSVIVDRVITLTIETRPLHPLAPGMFDRFLTSPQKIQYIIMTLKSLLLMIYSAYQHVMHL